MNRLQDKVALVTGAGAGIGEQICLRFAAEGAKIVGMDLRENELVKVAAAISKAGGHFLGLPGDVTSEADCRRVVEEAEEKLGSVQVLCNVAGVVEMGTLVNAQEAQWQRSVDVNMKGMWYMSRLVVPLMQRQRGGSIVNIASVAGPFAVKERGVYSVTKAGVIGLTKSLAADHITEGIRVNAICPGTVESPSWHDRVNQAPDPKQALADFIARQPMGRVGQPEEIAALAAYLAADESAYMTGQALYIDGGMTM